jgi:hypothetical protein
MFLTGPEDYVSCKPPATGGMRASMLFYDTIIGTIALVLAGGNLYYQREAVQLMKARAVSPRQRAAMAAKSWWRSPQVAVVTLLAALTWVPWIYGLVSPPADDAYYVGEQVQWGGLPDGEQYVSVILKETKPDRKVILVALHYSGIGDIKDAVGLQKSKPYDYTKGLQTFIVDPDQGFRNAASAVKLRVSFILLDIPNTITPDQFSTIRQAVALGGKIILTRATVPQ